MLPDTFNNEIIAHSVSPIAGDNKPHYQKMKADAEAGDPEAIRRYEATLVCPDGRRCRDSSLHDETFLKENLETLFAYRQAVGFRPNTPEPEEGWMGELASELVRLGRSIEEADDLPPLPAPPAWTESKQRHREALKKLALGQKLSRGQSWQQTMW